jgi:hypothetical protein
MSVVGTNRTSRAGLMMSVVRGRPEVIARGRTGAFDGALLARATVKGHLGGEIYRDWKPEGLTIRLSVARNRITVD